MGEPDISEKILADYNDVFADIINAIIFKGEQRILPDQLQDASVHSQYKADDRKLHENERDISKYWKDCNINLSILGLENQTVPDAQMPFRILNYDGMSYRKQLLSNTIIAPVITLVLYFGEQRWNYSRNLKDCLSIPEGMEEYVNDYHIHVVEVSFLSDEEIERFHSDFKVVAKFFKNRRINPDYLLDDAQTITHVDEILKLLYAMTKDYRYEELVINHETGGIRNLNDIGERIHSQGKAEGLAEGLAEGKAEGLAEGLAEGEVIGIEKVALGMLKKGISDEIVLECSEMSLEKLEQLKKKI